MQGVIDCHIHVVVPQERFPQQPTRHYLAAPASVGDVLRAAAGEVSRFVVVQPSFYGTDNRATLEGVAELRGHGRAVAVIDRATAEDATALEGLHAAGVRGLRVNLNTTLRGDTRELAGEIAWQAQVAARMGWHLQIVVPFETLVSAAEVIAAQSVSVVIDHFGLPLGETPASAQGRRLVELVGLPHVWVKLSAPYRVGADPLATTPPSDWMAAFVDAAPDRCVWGSDWPHTPLKAQQASPDEVAPYRAIRYPDLIRHFIAALPAQRAERVLRTNAERLYGF